MATINSTTEPSMSGKLRRAIGTARRVLAQRTEALRGAINKAVGEEDEDDQLSNDQREAIRSFDAEVFIDSFDFLFDARS
ncbi:hypothetical protein PRIPAC_82461 [Pristionchus pacificus]|uniref:Uncharacterized protein n=1 Tax=Pristionchus pacificus TaxID=54126 RepID=A0A2A6CBP1_PRIPA|nr:hypothetical protein PRIPAC_82461 [Pristionchus pacificus]|eukprot:PDM75536.1 hypothetical protein PRIPAC_42713 [Pristionchus pacificus]